MSDKEKDNSVPESTRETIERYYQGCNDGDVEAMVSTMTPDVVHYFLEPGTEAVAGAEHLARYWRKVQQLLSAHWEIDHMLGGESEAAIEWTLFWTNPDTGMRIATRGAEFYVMREGLMAEIRAYYNQLRDADSGLIGFAYAARGYSDEQVNRPVGR